jgi:uncharacterized membrane protein YphA (DoxX/SURF4 family)
MKLFLKIISHPITLGIFRVLLGFLFVISSITKIQEPAKFMDSIEAYGIIPKLFVHPMAMIVPWLQIAAGLLFIFDIYSQSAALIISGLLAAYTIAIAQAFARGLSMECGCFDMIPWMEDKVGWSAIIRDLIFLGMSGSVFLFDKNTVNIYGLIKKLFKQG